MADDKHAQYSLFDGTLLGPSNVCGRDAFWPYDGDTTVVNILDDNSINETTGKYALVGLVSKYGARIQRTTMSIDKTMKDVPSREVLFNGILVVHYRPMVGQLGLGTYDDPRAVRIWTARPGVQWELSTGLHDLLFDGAKDKDARIDEILAAEHARLQRVEKKNTTALRDSFSRGMAAGEARSLGHGV